MGDRAMPAKGIQIDASFDCAMRVTSTLITAGPGGPPQAVPARPMPGRRWLRIMNNGRIVAGQRADVQVMIGNQDIAFVNPIEGFGLEIDEFIDLPFDDSIAVYAIVNVTDNETADLRTIELR